MAAAASDTADSRGDASDQFLNMIRFEQRQRLAGLLLDLHEN